MTKKQIKAKLEYLRDQIEKECISYGEIMELQDLADHIDENDTVLLEWAGMPENRELNRTHTTKEIKEARQAVIDSNQPTNITTKRNFMTKKQLEERVKELEAIIDKDLDIPTEQEKNGQREVMTETDLRLFLGDENVNIQTLEELVLDLVNGIYSIDDLISDVFYGNCLHKYDDDDQQAICLTCGKQRDMDKRGGAGKATDDGF